METKPWYLSMTQWGAGIVAICAVILPAIGKADLAKVVVDSQVDIANAITGIGAVIGLVLVIVGRFRATTVLTK